MNLKTWIPLILAVALGVIAMVVAKKALHPSSEADQPKTIASVVVVRHDVPAGKEIALEDVTEIKMPAGHVPSRSFSNVKQVQGRVPTNVLVKGQPVLDTQLAPSGTGSGLQAMIPEGMRAITIEVNEFSGLVGMLLPGSRVDIVSVVRDERAQTPMSRTILQNVKVLAVGRNLSSAPAPDGSQPPPTNNVTLLVEPKQAQALQLAMQAGRPWLVLRNGRDEAIVEVQVTSMTELNSPNGEGFRNERDPFVKTVAMEGSTTRPVEPATQPIVKSTRTVQIINGGVVTQIEVPVSSETSDASIHRDFVPPAPQPRTEPPPQTVLTDEGPIGLNSQPKQPEIFPEPQVTEPSEPRTETAVKPQEPQIRQEPQVTEPAELRTETAVKPQEPEIAEDPEVTEPTEVPAETAVKPQEPELPQPTPISAPPLAPAYVEAPAQPEVPSQAQLPTWDEVPRIQAPAQPEAPHAVTDPSEQPGGLSTPDGDDLN